MLVDSHCHLDFNDFEEDFDEILERARANGVTAMLNAGNNIDELDNQLALSEKYPFIYTAVGVDRKSTRLNSSHKTESRMPSSA